MPGKEQKPKKSQKAKEPEGSPKSVTPKQSVAHTISSDKKMTSALSKDTTQKIQEETSRNTAGNVEGQTPATNKPQGTPGPNTLIGTPVQKKIEVVPIQAMRTEMNQMMNELYRKLDESMDRKIKEITDSLGKKADKEDLNKLEQKLKETNEKLAQTSQNVQALETSIENQVKLAQTRQNVQALETSIENQVKSCLDEAKERESRKLNIIVYNVGESSSEDLTERKEQDTLQVNQVMASVGLDIEIDSQLTIRLGKKPERDDSEGGEQEPRPRPLRLTVPDVKTKIDILKAAPKIKDLEDDSANKIRIRPDMTPNEREADKKLYNEWLEKKEMSKNQGDTQTKWIRRNGKVIKGGTDQRRPGTNPNRKT